jgi:single-stranded-DNA-specific exonuclease
MQAEAESILAAWTTTTIPAAGMCLYHPNWHQGVTGLLASRLKEKFYRPIVVFAPGEKGELKGSARSIPGLHIRDLLARIASLYPHCLLRFGGHAMAAGMTLEEQHYPEFKQAYERISEAWLSDIQLNQVLLTDGLLEDDEICLENAHDLEQAAPWGQHFEAPIFVGVFSVSAVQWVGQQKQHLRLTLALSDGRLITAMGFSMDTSQTLHEGDTINIAYRLSVNTFRQVSQVQMIIVEMIGE